MTGVPMWLELLYAKPDLDLLERAEIQTLLGNDAFEAYQGNPVHAATLLVDATVAVLVSCLDADGAVEIGNALGLYLSNQVRERAGGGPVT